MPNGGLSVGRDITLRFNFLSGPLEFPTSSIESFEAKPMAPLKNYVALDGLLQPVLFHEGWDISISIARKSNLLDQFWALQEAEYYAGTPQPGGTITETIQEANGSISQYLYTNFVIKLDNAGMWKGNEFVIQTLIGQASRKEQLL